MKKQDDKLKKLLKHIDKCVSFNRKKFGSMNDLIKLSKLAKKYKKSIK